jgi:hypothetical protein
LRNYLRNIPRLLNSITSQEKPRKNVRISAIGKEIHRPFTPNICGSIRIDGKRKIKCRPADRNVEGRPFPMP